jgi:AcrR family transcriptional regulator
MARPLNPRIRARLRDQAVDYVLSHGVADLALRPLAQVLKTNARMLVYHFGSREGLMRAILAGLREREDARIRAWFDSRRKTHTLPDFLRWYWQRLSAPRARPAARLIFELYALALRDPEAYPGVLTDPLLYWRKLAEKAGVPSTVNAAEATLFLAATRGLLLDLCATGDGKRVTGAMKLLAGLMQPGTRRGAHRRRTRAPGAGAPTSR